MQVPSTHASPAPQQIGPHPTPVVHVPLGKHAVIGLASGGAEHGRAVQSIPVAVQVQSLQLSPAGQVSPTA